MKNFSEKLKNARRRTGLTQKEASERLEIPIKTYINWEQDYATPAEWLKESILIKLNYIVGEKFSSWKYALNRYQEDCLKFAHDTKEWGKLDEFKYYLTSTTDNWYESCDGNEGGISLDWAFHEDDYFIKANSNIYFFNELLEILQNVDIEETEQLDNILEEFLNP